MTLLPRTFWKIVYKGKNSAIHKLIVSISYVDSCLAWSYSNWVKRQPTCPVSCLWVSFSCSSTVDHLFLLHCSRVHLCSAFCQVFHFATSIGPEDPSNHQYLVCQVCTGERPYQRNGLCKACVCKDCGCCTVPWSFVAAWAILLGRTHHYATLVTLCSLEKETHECLGL